jgi:hypothetical protein
VSKEKNRCLEACVGLVSLQNPSPTGISECDLIKIQDLCRLAELTSTTVKIDASSNPKTVIFIEEKTN